MYGGGTINRKFLSILLLLITIALPLNVGAISAAATNQTTDNINLNNKLQTTQVQNSTHILNKSINNTTSSNINDIVNTSASKHNYAAAGTVKNTTIPVTLTLSSINLVAAKLGSYIRANHKLPAYIMVSGKNMTLSQFLYLITVDVIKINSNSRTSITLKTVKTPILSVAETFTNGNIQKTEYITIAKNVYNFINFHGTAPITASSSHGLIRYESLIYTFSKVLDYYNTNKRLPGYVYIQRGIVKTPTISASSSSSNQTVIPASIMPYLDPTKNCQSNSTVVKSCASSITQGLTTQKDKAVAIFNWVRDNIEYSFYYNTNYGALGTLNSRTANCVDTSHLMIALMRAAGIPAKYEHVYAQFTSGEWYGHVIALVYINDVWYKADGTNSKNQFGIVNNWNTTTATVYGTYKELLF